MDKNKLIEDNMKLVYYLVKKYYPTFINNDDVIQEGMVGLCMAADSYDESKSKFSTFASRCILNQIRYYFKANQKHNNVLSLDKETPLEDGGVTSFAEYTMGDEDINISSLMFEEFYYDLDDYERLLLELLKVYKDEVVSQRLGISQSTLYSKKRKIMRKWRKFNGKN